MGDDERVETGPAEDHACLPLELCQDDTHPIAREESQTVTVPEAALDDPLRWPRYCIGRRVSGHMQLALYLPSGTSRTRYTPFTADHYRRYMEAAERPMPDIASSGTWGPSEQWTLPVCRLDEQESGERHLVFDGGSAPRRTFTVFGLSASQPGWERFLKRTLMAFPNEHCEWGQLQTVYLDFFLGTTRIGLNERNQPPPVSSGGANWPHYPDEVPAARRQVPADPHRTSVVCISYAALNREWAGRNGTRRATEEQIDAGFTNLNHQAGTLYHEFGHIFHFLRNSQIPHEERAHRPPILDNDSRGGLFDEYRAAAYSSAGRSQGPTEGVAEAYRSRLQGHRPSGPADLARRVSEALDQAGLPTQTSVTRAQRQIAEYVRQQGW
jgi:hypothetical protein